MTFVAGGGTRLCGQQVTLGEAESCFEFPTSIPNRFAKTPVLAEPGGDLRITAIACVDQLNGDTLQIACQTGVDQSSNAARRVFTYAVVNGLARPLLKGGATLVSIEPKDIEKTDYSKPVQFRVELAQPGGAPLYMFIRIFFTDRGYSVASWSNDKERLDDLVPLILSVKPGQNP